MQHLDADPVGVFAWVTRSGHPTSCAVTPYLVDGHPVVTSTAALIAKAAAVRRDDRVSLLAGGVQVVGTGTVGFDPSSGWFDANLRTAELAKYPPARSLLAVPGHRRLFSWYVARAVIRIEPSSVTRVRPDHRLSIAVLDADGHLQLVPLDHQPERSGDRQLLIGEPLPDGRAVLLIHEENPKMTDLRQRRFFGVMDHGVLDVERDDGSLEPDPKGTLAQLRLALDLGRRARRNRHRLAAWPTPDRCSVTDHGNQAVTGG
jgi:hypothetical protein